MKILINSGGIAQTNCFVVADEAAKQAVLFDAPDHTTGPLLDEIAKRGWDLIGLWLTHGHFDHFADHQVVTDRFPAARVLIHPLDLLKIQRPDLQTRLFGLPFTIPPRASAELVEDGQILHIGSMSCRVMHTPGHAPGHVMYYFESQKVVVGGDLIIGGSVGRTDLPDSDEDAMADSLRLAMTLPDATQLLPGHGQVSTIGQERATNEVLRSLL